ncbi:MAG: PIN domain-containing protein [Candidatus Burarchaeum sp.]|nr:PIN domain-containing protein [Candidatus Burarchaeum sp.]MDO8339176.1 PIN domain-containing protein [Candidatus Burarchaeum sp.]
MKLVVDANIIIAAFIRDAAVRKLLLRPDNCFCCPEFIIEEIKGHFEEMLEKSRLSREDAKKVLELVFDRIEIIPAQKVAKHLGKAELLMGGIDKDDVPYVALALAIQNDGIWSDDPHFQKLKGNVRVWRTAELINLL